MVSKHAVNMCLVQLGEFSARIRDLDKHFYQTSGLSLPQIKGMRDRIAHSYGDIDYKVVKAVLKNDIPILKTALENSVHKDVLANPYFLYEMEYDDFIASLSEPQKTPLDIQINSAASKVSAQNISHTPSKKEYKPER